LAASASNHSDLELCNVTFAESRVGSTLILDFFIGSLLFCAFLLREGFRYVRERRKSESSLPLLNGKGSADSAESLLGSGRKKSIAQLVAEFFKVFYRVQRVSLMAVAEEKGAAAMLYLTFQRYTIIILSLISFLSLVIILPINITGGNQYCGFAVTTYQNINFSDTGKLWALGVMSCIFSILFYVFLYFFQHRVVETRQKLRSLEPLAGRTLMVRGIPVEKRTQEDVADFFSSHGCTLEVTRFLHITTTIMARRKELRRVMTRRRRMERKGERTKDIDVEVKAAKERLKNAVDEELQPDGIAFASFLSADDADVAAKKLRLPVVGSACRSHFSVYQAPAPKDIIWKNIRNRPLGIAGRMLAVNIPLFLLFFLFTTPVSLFSAVTEVSIAILQQNATDVLDKYAKAIESLPTLLRSLAFSYIPTLITLIVNTIMLTCIKASTRLEGHWSSADVQKSALKKSFAFLLLNVLVLPALALSSAASIITYIQTGDVWTALGDIFLLSSGTFFVNYVIQATFTSAILSVFHLFDSIVFGIIGRLFSRCCRCCGCCGAGKGRERRGSEERGRYGDGEDEYGRAHSASVQSRPFSFSSSHGGGRVEEGEEEEDEHDRKRYEQKKGTATSTPNIVRNEDGEKDESRAEADKSASGSVGRVEAGRIAETGGRPTSFSNADEVAMAEERWEAIDEELDEVEEEMEAASAGIEYASNRMSARHSVVSSKKGQRRREGEKKEEKALFTPPPPHFGPFTLFYYYALCLSILALAMTFSVTVPIIAPAALLYFCVRRVVDKYNIVVLSPPSVLNIHGTLSNEVIDCALGALLTGQLVMAGFLKVKGAEGPFILTLIFFAFTLLLLLGPRAKVAEAILKKINNKRKRLSAESTLSVADSYHGEYVDPYLIAAEKMVGEVHDVKGAIV